MSPHPQETLQVSMLVLPCFQNWRRPAGAQGDAWRTPAYSGPLQLGTAGHGKATAEQSPKVKALHRAVPQDTVAQGGWTW